MKRLARAKINLTLSVTGRRADGYHLLDSVVVFADFGDRLSAEKSSEISLEITGPFAKALPAGPDNLVLKAAHLLRAESGSNEGAALHLEKNLPVASGIGGGSADAAAALDLLNEFWGLGLPQDKLQALGLKLGADVPVCLLSQTALMQGIGERITVLPQKADFALALVNPGRAVSTAAIFAALGREPGSGAISTPPSDILNADLRVVTAAGGNDLQSAAIAQAPEIQTVLDGLNAFDDCQFARMSGSGATCFGLFGGLDQADAAAAKIAADYPHWWTKAVSIR